MITRLKRWVTKKLAGVIPQTLEERWKWLPTHNMFDPDWMGAFLPGGAIADNAVILSRIEEVVPYAFDVPLLSDYYCDWLVELADARDKWSEDKKDDYAGWEVNLSKVNSGVDAYHRSVVIGDVLTPVLGGLFRWQPDSIYQIFLIKYSASTIPSMAPHMDEFCEMSVSINLNDPEEYEGGELSFVRSPKIMVSRPKGHALIFSGGPTMMHQAHPVTEGTRYVLVYWLK